MDASCHGICHGLCIRWREKDTRKDHKTDTRWKLCELRNTRETKNQIWGWQTQQGTKKRGLENCWAWEYSINVLLVSHQLPFSFFPTSFPHIFSYFLPVPPYPVSTFPCVLPVTLFLFAFSLPTLCLPFPLLLSQFINCLSRVPKAIAE